MELLEKHFETALESPGGIKKLRQLILTLAMQGKLVDQDPKDKPASDLLKEIEAEKKRLINEGKLKKQKPLPEIKPEEVPYELPEGWVWCRLGEMSLLENGDRSKKYPNENDYVSTGIPFFGAKDMINGYFVVTNELRFISKEKFNSLSQGKLLHDDFVILIRGSVGKIALFKNDISFDTGFINAQMVIIRLFDKLFVDYLFHYFFSALYNKMVRNNTTGSAVQQMPASTLSLFTIPLPPLAEQKRIVTKINQLMALCDKLETEQEQRNQKQLNLLQASLSALTQARNPTDFQKAWSFVARHFDSLYSVKENVAELKKAILTLAMQGKLVEQDPNDQPAEKHLEEIRAQKEKLIKEGKLKKQKPLPEIKPEEVPYELPSGWVWCRLGDVLKNVVYGTSHKTCNNSTYIPVLRMGNITKSGEIIYNNLKYISAKVEGIAQLYLENNDLVFNRTNSFELVGKCGLFKTQDRKYTLASYLIKATPFHAYVLADFINNYINSTICRKTQIEPQITIQTNQANFNGTKLKNILFPFAPISEQKRIVAKVYYLNTLCDQLETQLDEASEKQTAFFDAVLARV